MMVQNITTLNSFIWFYVWCVLWRRDAILKPKQFINNFILKNIYLQATARRKKIKRKSNETVNVIHFLRKYTYNKNIFAKVISNVVQIEFYFYVLILSQEVQSFQYCSNLFNVNKWREKSIGSSIRFLSYQFWRKRVWIPQRMKMLMLMDVVVVDVTVSWST